MSDQGKGSDRRLDMVSMGCRWVLDVSALDDESAVRTRERWRRCAELATRSTPLLDDAPETVVAEPTQQAYDLSRELTRRGLIRLRGRVTLLHAAALTDESGRALALVAPSGGGKSTSTRVLGRRLGYLSDETVVLLDDHRIAPHPKPPSLVVDPGTRWRKDEPPPDELGLGATVAEPYLARLLTLARDAEVGEPTIEPVGLVDQLLAVLPETSSTWLVPGGLHRLARAVTAGGPPARLRYAEITDCHDLVRDHLASPDAVAPVWEHLGPDESQRWRDEDGRPGTDRSDPSGPPTATDRLVRAPWSDAVAHDGEVLVLVGAHPLRLAGVGAVLWRTAKAPRTLADLTEAVVAELGDHPDAEGLVHAAAADLVEHGALRHALA